MRRRLDYKLIISIDLFNYKEDIKDNELHYVTLTSVPVMLYSGAKTYRNIFFSAVVLYRTSKDHGVFSSAGHLNDRLWNGQHPLWLSVIGQLLRVKTQSSVGTLTECVQISIG